MQHISHHKLIGSILALIVFSPAVVCSQTATTSAESILAANYDFKLAIESNLQQNSQRIRFRDGETIRVQFKDFRANLKITSLDRNNYVIQLYLFERTDGATYAKPTSSYWQINPSAIEIRGEFSKPIHFGTKLDEIELDLAISVSMLR